MSPHSAFSQLSHYHANSARLKLHVVLLQSKDNWFIFSSKVEISVKWHCDLIFVIHRFLHTYYRARQLYLFTLLATVRKKDGLTPNHSRQFCPGFPLVLNKFSVGSLWSYLLILLIINFVLAAVAVLVTRATRFPRHLSRYGLKSRPTRWTNLFLHPTT